MSDNVPITSLDEVISNSSERSPPSKMPVRTKSKKRHSASSASGSSESVGSKSNGPAAAVNTASLSCGAVSAGDDEPVTDMFHIDGTGFDVTLSPRLGKIYWELMNPNGRRRIRSGSLTGLFRRRKSSSGLRDPAQNNIDLQKLYGARIKRRRKVGQNENEGYVLGLGLFTYEQKADSNLLREREIYFEHPSVEICTCWSARLNTFINAIDGRPKNVKMFLQPYAGEKNGCSIYKEKILPLFQNAGVAIDLTVINHNEHVKQDMIHFNIEDFDCVIAMGGDGTVNQVLNGLMNRSQKEQEVEKRPGFCPAKAIIPLGIIPIGKTNHVAFSLMGTADPVTAALHIAFGHWSPVDVCTVCTPETFHCWAFNCQYGFAGNVLSFMKRYSTLGTKCIDAAFLKALTSSKLRSYECEIDYIPSSNVNGSKFNTVCRTGCALCTGDKKSGKDSGPEVITEMVQELDLNNSVSSHGSGSSFIELKKDDPWQTLKGKFMNVSVFTIPGNCDIAPQGLSKYTHLHDGNIDLVAVKTVDRKDFIRFLRRHGNSKNQFDFAFLEVVRCKEVRFRPRIPTSWSYSDHDFSEIKYQMSQQQQKKQLHHRSMEIVADTLDSGETSLAKNLQDKSKSMYDLNISDNEEDGEEKSGGAGDVDVKIKERDEDYKETTAVGREESEMPRYHYVGQQYQPTWKEQETARRKALARKKEEKRKTREEEKSRSVWNLDNEICTTLELDFKVHSGLLLVCGQGISPHTEFNDVRFGCLPA